MKIAIRIVLICLLAVVLVTIGAMVFQPKEKTNPINLTLNGEQVVLLEYGQAYTEAGATAVSAEGNAPIPVTISGQVNTSRLGKYLLKYTAQNDGCIRTEYRYVHVIDTEAPAIMLTSNPDAYTLIGETYQEEGFYATDNHDGNLTGKVVRREVEGVMYYTVTDSMGNTTTVTREINYIDPNAPIISLKGGQKSYIWVGESYAEPGCTATDFRDGDLSSRVIVSGDVDGNLPGVYTVKYAITNSLGVEAVKERTVYVFPKQEDEKEDDTPVSDNPNDLPAINPPTTGTVIDPSGKTIYLTFDDGPGVHTERLLDVLKKYGVKVTFFVTNTKYISTLTRAAEEGHTIAIHTYTHDYAKIYASDNAFMADLEATQKMILERTGIKSMLTRFPGGSSNSISANYNRGIMSRLTKKLEELGYQYFDWNVDSNDAGGAKNAEEVFKNIVDGIDGRQNSVVLQHDTKGFSVDAVEQIIVWGLSNGYTFAPLDENSPTCHHGVRN